MISPDFTSFKKLAKKGNLVAVTTSVPADLETPVSSFLKLAGKSRHAFLLESAEQAEQVGRFSILGLDPELILKEDRGRIVCSRGARQEILKGRTSLITVIEEMMSGFRLANPEALEGFSGGFVGYFGYESVRHFEDVELSDKKGRSLPDGIFFLTREMLIFDHFLKKLKIVSIVRVDQKHSLLRQYQQASHRIEGHVRTLRRPLKLPRSKPQTGKLALKPNMTRPRFEEKVKRVKEYIRAGDCIQVVLSQRFDTKKFCDDFQIYRALRSINPSPYTFYFRSGDLRLVGSSPELLVQKTGRVAEVRPIAGTRPRGKTRREDLRYEDNLKKSPKEMAEHLMLVDLGRNDIGRVCQFKSVKVDEFARVERYSHVMHLVSDVSGLLKPGKTSFDLLKATFPAGTLTGAPKIRAMQIIDELEPERRGPYGGCLGYFGFNQDMDMCITIRTIVVSGNTISLQAGAGIVKDSNPGKEYEETVNKASALLKALQAQGEF